MLKFRESVWVSEWVSEWVSQSVNQLVSEDEPHVGIKGHSPLAPYWAITSMSFFIKENIATKYENKQLLYSPNISV